LLSQSGLPGTLPQQFFPAHIVERGPCPRSRDASGIPF
jgi:hypothetical protein